MANPAVCNQQENLDECNGMRRTHQCTPSSDEPPIQVLADNLMNCYVRLLPFPFYIYYIHTEARTVQKSEGGGGQVVVSWA
jgi:hypothetical protein